MESANDKLIEKWKLKSWKEIKDTVYGNKGTNAMVQERDFVQFQIGLQLKKTRREKQLTNQTRNKGKRFIFRKESRKLI
jgi:hypothetical protein